MKELSGSAILGLYAGIKICIRDGYDWRKVAELVEPIAKEHAADCPKRWEPPKEESK